jgi:hypothetical protein
LNLWKNIMPTRNPTASKNLATAASIHHVFGDVDDTVVTAIIAMGATEADLLEAAQWMRADDELGSTLERGPQGVVRELCELLAADEPEEPG